MRKMPWILIVVVTLICLMACFIPDLSKAQQTDIESPYCINGVGFFHIKNSPDIWKTGEKRFNLTRDIGASMDRSDFWWSYLEPEKGKFDWAFPDAVMAEYQKHNISIYPILCYNSQWSNGISPHTQEERELFGKYVFLTVSRYKKQVRYWEIWNEPNLGTFWSPQPNAKDYAELLKVAYKAAKAADPTCQIVAPSLAGADFTFLEQLYKYGIKGYYDIFSYHYYRTDAPEKNSEIVKEIQRIQEFLNKQGDPKHIFITEMGITSIQGESGVSENDQASLLVRNYMELLSTKVVDKIFWFSLIDWAQDPASPPWDAHLGLVRNNLEYKPAATAYSIMSLELKGKKYIGEIKSAPGIYQYIFIDDTSSCMVAWTTDTAHRSIQYPTDGSRVDIQPAVSTSTITWSSDTLNHKYMNISLTQSPIFISPVPAELVQRASLQINPRYLEIPIGLPTPVEVTITNRGDKTLTGQVKVSGAWDWSIQPNIINYSIESGKTEIYTITVKTAKSIKEGSYLLKFADISTATPVFSGQEKEFYAINPLQSTLKMPSNVSNPKDSVLNYQITNVSSQEFKGNLSLTCSDAFTPLKSTQSVQLAPKSITTVQFPIKSTQIPQTFNGRFTVTYTLGGYLSYGKESTLYLYNKDVAYFPITKTKRPVIIDGKLDDWKGIKPLMDETSEIKVNMSPDAFMTKDDLSARCYISWDEKYLYVALDVTDNQTTIPTNKSYWDFDSFQIAIDPKNDSLVGFDSNDYELEGALTSKGAEIFAGTQPLNHTLDFNALVRKSFIQKPNNKGYVYEMAIPSTLIPELTFKPGNSFGFCALVNDNDGQGRKGWVESTSGIGLGKNPDAYLKIILTK